MSSHEEKLTDARLWLKRLHALAYLGEHWVLAQPQPKQPLKQLPPRAVSITFDDVREIDKESEVSV